MKLLPDSRNLKEHKLFARAYYGEAAGLALGLFAVIRMGSIEFNFVGPMLVLLIIHAFLIWAWSRRYPLMNWFYALWNLPTLAVLLTVAAGIFWSWTRPHGFRITPAGIQIGDGSITLLGLAALLTAIASRSTGLYWCFFRRSTIEFNEAGYAPAALLVLFLIISGGYLFIDARPLAHLFMIGGMGFYGLGISI